VCVLVFSYFDLVVFLFVFVLICGEMIKLMIVYVLTPYFITTIPT